MNLKQWSSLTFSLLCLPLLGMAQDAPEDTTSSPEVLTETTSAFGKVLEGSAQFQALEELLGLSAKFDAKVLGRKHEILSVEAQMNELLEGESEFYWGGLRVASARPLWKGGAFQFSALLPPVLMRAPLVSVPLGLITVKVDAGVGAEAEVDARLQPNLAYPVQFSSVSGHLTPRVRAAGFLEGYARFLFFRGGVGGEIELLRADLQAEGFLSFHQAPLLQLSGFVSFLKGGFYAFLDTFDLGSFRWRRTWKPSLYEWPGICRSWGSAGTCGN